tara:strand:- start:1750 stop:1878 length:129 start_codon:yes stop_codon:yes gene_type:complete
MELDNIFGYYYQMQNGNNEYNKSFKELIAILKHIKKICKEVA